MKIQVTDKLSPSMDQIIFVKSDGTMPKGIDKNEFNGEDLSICLLHREVRQLHVGIGAGKNVNGNILRKACGAAIRHLIGVGSERVVLRAGSFPKHIQSIVEGAIMAAYKYETFMMPAQRRKTKLKALSVLVSKAALQGSKKAAASGQILAEASNYTRQLGNSPGNVMTPVELAKQARKLAKTDGLKCRVWDVPALKKGGFGGILAVGQGSANDPRFIVLEHKPNKKNVPTIAIVGKAITFDSGGISLKPGEQMDEMKFDKMGGCAVLGVMQAVKRLNLPVHVVGLIASAENMPSSKAYRPGDIVTSYDKKTIEVLNTDAEGRIVLSDALAYARKHYKPDFMIDMATLTGACVVALGQERAGLFTDDENACEALCVAGASTGERVWPLPMGDEFDTLIKSEFALVKNLGGRWGGASTGASFLKVWAEDTPWAHIDIAGVAWTTTGFPYLEKGATGFGVRLVTAYIRDQYCS